MLKSLHLVNFTVFPDTKFKFGKNLNVIVGENGTGKSHILKAAYSAIAVSAARAKDGGANPPNKSKLEAALAEKLQAGVSSRWTRAASPTQSGPRQMPVEL